jgi:hypothetical protein
MGSTTQTVKNRVHQMLQELGADNSRHAIAQAFRGRIVAVTGQESNRDAVVPAARAAPRHFHSISLKNYSLSS